MPISRMQQPRQMYGLGSLVKSVGKAVKGAVKGITGAVKDNPLLAAAALNFAPMLLPGGKPFIGMGGGQFNIPGGLTDIFTKKASEKTLGDTLKVFAGGSLLGGLLSQAEKEGDPEGITRNVGALKLKLADAYRNQRTFADAEDEEAAIAKQVELDTAEYNQDMNRGVLATGGRIGFFKGAQADARAGKGAMSPGTSMSGGFRGGGDGGGNSGPSGPPSIINAPQPTPKKNIFDKIRNNPIYRTVSPFVNPFSIGMSQLPFKAQKAIGISSLLNKFGNIFFPPAGAAEFDMEAFKKAGADKGFFGMNDELEAMQKYYDFAQKQKAMGKDPAAIRDSANIGKSLYGIDMDLVPETFLQTEKDFETQKAPISFFNLGGRAGYAFGNNPEQNAMEAAGIEGLPLNQNPAGVKELDLRNSGGFIPPVGVKEKADDIPAMLSNNEFVFTADAVRNMGNGNVNVGAQRMYDMMKYLEKGGRV